MKIIKGNANYIVRHLMHEVMAQKVMNENGQMVPKVSRHDQKQSVREKMKNEGRPCAQADLAKHMPIYSNKSKHDYSKAWLHFFKYMHKEHNIKDVEKVRLSHVKKYLATIINSDVKYSTFKTYCAHLSKLEVAMNKVRRQPLYYSEQIKEFKGYARKMLNTDHIVTRAYLDPEKVINNLTGKHKVAAELQLFGGARISEISELKIERNFLGIQGEFGLIKMTNTKGGRIREMKVPADTYNRALEYAKSEGQFSITRRNYARSLKIAAESIFERYTGTHGLRWNYAQIKYYEYQKAGMSQVEAMKQVSYELGHSRAEITMHYLN